MSIRISGVIIDATDLDLMARFWGELLGLQITRRESPWVVFGPELALQSVPEAKTVKNRIHLDLVADDFVEAIAHAVALGAKPVGGIQENLWQVLQDPEGNEFCICKP